MSHFFPHKIKSCMSVMELFLSLHVFYFYVSYLLQTLAHLAHLSSVSRSPISRLARWTGTRVTKLSRSGTLAPVCGGLNRGHVGPLVAARLSVDGCS